MMRIIQLTLSILLLAGGAAANGTYETIDTTDVLAHPEAHAGRLVEVRAEVIAIGADSKSLQLFDSKTRMMIGVNLNELSRSQRTALMRNPVRQLLVHGQITVVEGRLVIDAHKVEALSLWTKSH